MYKDLYFAKQFDFYIKATLPKEKKVDKVPRGGTL